MLTFNYMQLKIVVLSGGSKKWCFDRLESDMMIFCEWLMEGVRFFYLFAGIFAAATPHYFIGYRGCPAIHSQ